MLRAGGWYFYLSGKEKLLDEHKCGKWMHFFTNQEFAMRICQKAIDEGACHECKCTDMELTGENTGVICFYLNGDDVENHKRILKFMIDNNLIQRTKAGKLYNISFKYDDQTRNGEYESDFVAKLKLDQFVNLVTGEFK